MNTLPPEAVDQFINHVSHETLFWINDYIRPNLQPAQQQRLHQDIRRAISSALPALLEKVNDAHPHQH